MSENIDSLRKRLDKNTLSAIEETFPSSQLRQGVAVELLAAWDRNPSNKERVEMSKRHGCSNSNIGKIIDKLMDVELFTTTLGSIPLYRDKRHSESMNENAVKLSHEEEYNPDDEEENEELEASISRQTPNKPLPLMPSEGGKSIIVPLGTMGDMEARMSEQDKRINSLERKLDSGFSTLEDLLKKGVDTPASIVKANTLTVEPEEPEEVEEIEQEPVRSGPFDNMTKEQILDMAMNSPEMIYALRNQGVPPTTDTIQAVAHTTRWIALELTTYTQAAFERACEDGYEGSLSDFVNNAVYKYFADRGKVLQWVDTMPRQQPYYPQPNMYPRRSND